MPTTNRHPGPTSACTSSARRRTTPTCAPAFTAKADGKGRFEFDLGPGDYLFHASAGLAAGWGVVRAVPGKKVTAAIAMFEEPAKDSRVSYQKTGRSALRLFLGAGSAGDQTGAISAFTSHPWEPFGFVGGGGQVVDLDPGIYTVQTSWRRSETSVICAVMAVEVREGETVTVRMPPFPKSSKNPAVSPNAWLLTYPRK